MSSVPFFAINTSCRTLECPRSPIARRAPQGKYLPRVRSVSESSGRDIAADVSSVTSPGTSKAAPSTSPSSTSSSSPPPTSPPPASPLPTSPPPTSSSPPSVFLHLSLPDTRTRSSSLNHLDKKKQTKTVDRERDILSILDIIY